MNDGGRNRFGQTRESGSCEGASLSSHHALLIPIYALGMATSLFFAISYVLCVVLYLLNPEGDSGHALLTLLLPWFKLLSWGSFLLGLIETFNYCRFVALVFKRSAISSRPGSNEGRPLQLRPSRISANATVRVGSYTSVMAPGPCSDDGRPMS